MEDFEIFIKIVLTLAGSGITILTFYNLYSAFIEKKKKPTTNLVKEVESLKEENEKRKDEVEELERKLRSYVDDKFIQSDKMVSKLNDDIRDLKVNLETNQKDIQMILNSLFAIGNYFVTEGSKDEIKKANDDIINHLIAKK